MTEQRNTIDYLRITVIEVYQNNLNVNSLDENL